MVFSLKFAMLYLFLSYDAPLKSVKKLYKIRSTDGAGRKLKSTYVMGSYLKFGIPTRVIKSNFRFGEHTDNHE